MSRLVIGVDLGTTNCAVAWADLDEVTRSGTPRVRSFPVPQLVAEGETGLADTLPSFLYLATPEERRDGRLALPWSGTGGDAPIAGAWARDRGALVPARLVSSAKSWLCHGGVDRRAALLPWSENPEERQLSPVEASTALLAHIRDAWNHAHAGGRARFEDAEIVLTVPASFDEEARELTVEAARAAAYARLTLIEEPSAALYAWIAANPTELAASLAHGDRVLICDVGGGTTDFTLVDVRVDGGELGFERVRVGEHLLLGGDNVDLALARLVEEKLDRPRLTLAQLQGLRRQCAIAKERLLGEPAPDRVTVGVLGAGRSVVGGALSTEVTRADVLQTVLDGFLPDASVDAAPGETRRAGLRELALPYASDPAITRHLAAFLRAGAAPTRPDVVLFNGGFFTPVETRSRVVDVVAGWFAERSDADWRPRVLANRSPATAVADGAAYYGLVRHGHGVRIGGGSPRAFYLGLRAGAPRPGASETIVQAVCILPHGVEEGTTIDLPDRSFTVGTNRLVAFTLSSSLTRRDGPGAVIAEPAGALHQHAPMVTELRFGKRSRQPEIPVRVQVRYTELGTLEVWLVSRDTEHRWRLHFQLRDPVRVPAPTGDGEERADAGLLPEDGSTERAAALIRQVFAPGTADASPAAPETLMALLEETFGAGRHAWPMGLIRPLCDVLLEGAAGRSASPRHEARFLNLLGFCLRPGFGATRDAARMTEARKLGLAGLTFPRDVQCQAEWLVLWQRLAGGLTPGQQQDLYQRHAANVGLGGRPPARKLAPQIERETWRLLAALEHLPAATRTALGEAVAARLERDADSASLLWALARVGSRVPFYGPANTVVPPAAAAGWARRLLDRRRLSDEAAVALVQMAALSGDAARDLPEELRQAAWRRLTDEGHPPELAARLLEVTTATRANAQRLYGESLPEGLRLEGGTPGGAGR